MKYISASDAGIEYRNLIPEERIVYVGNMIKNLFSTATKLTILNKNILDENTKQYNRHLVFWAQYYHGLLVENYAYKHIEPWSISLTLKKGIHYLNHMEMSIQYSKMFNIKEKE